MLFMKEAIFLLAYEPIAINVEAGNMWDSKVQLVFVKNANDICIVF